MIVSKKLLDRLRAAFKRYGDEVLGDPDITVDFFPTEFEEFFGVLLTSPKFESMLDAERQDSVWDYMSSDPEITSEQFLEWFPGVERSQVKAELNYEMMTLALLYEDSLVLLSTS
jgi:hypothetical protein